MTWWPWTAGCMPWEAMTAAPASTPSRNTTRGPTSGWLLPACSRGAAASAWPCWSCSTSRRPLRPRCPCRPPASDPRRGLRRGPAPRPPICLKPRRGPRRLPPFHPCVGSGLLRPHQGHPASSVHISGHRGRRFPVRSSVFVYVCTIYLPVYLFSIYRSTNSTAASSLYVYSRVPCVSGARSPSPVSSRLSEGTRER